VRLQSAAAARYNFKVYSDRKHVCNIITRGIVEYAVHVHAKSALTFRIKQFGCWCCMKSGTTAAIMMTVLHINQLNTTRRCGCSCCSSCSCLLYSSTMLVQVCICKGYTSKRVVLYSMYSAAYIHNTGRVSMYSSVVDARFKKTYESQSNACCKTCSIAKC
jgi:hypothetical protein